MNHSELPKCRGYRRFIPSAAPRIDKEPRMMNSAEVPIFSHFIFHKLGNS